MDMTLVYDYRELNRLFSLYNDKASMLTALQILDVIFEDSDDKKMHNRHVKYKNNELYSDLAYLVPECLEELCNKKKCNNCFVNKWCNHFRKNAIKKAKETINYADFFCGAGGLSLGFRQEQFSLTLANDIQKSCIETYIFNHPETPSKHILNDDINSVLSDINSLKRYDRTDVVIGGPPCQGFSTANRQRLIDDPRNRLYKSFVNAVDILKPKMIVMENVRGILKVEKQIREDFERIGYIVEARLLNAKDFGVPQNRERVIFIGNNFGIENRLIFDYIDCLVKRAPSVSLHEAINDLPVLSAKTTINATETEDDLSGHNISFKNQCEVSNYVNKINLQKKSIFLYNHKARYNNARDIEIYSRMEPGNNSADPKIADIMPYKNRENIFKDKYYKLEPNKVCKTITAHMKYDCNMYIHPFQARGLTPREAARVQSYPDDYYFKSAYTLTYMQIGNSVPPLMSRTIAKAIKKFIRME